MKIHFVSGLGADEKIFEYLELPGIEKVYLKWIKPDKNDSIQDYALKLLNHTALEKNLILCGVSFGGMICHEMAKIADCRRVYVISSIKTVNELSLQLKIVKNTRIDKLFPATIIKKLGRLTRNYYMGATSKEEAEFINSIIKGSDHYFLKWAIDAIMKWNNKTVHEKLLHIHGTNDRIFPVEYIQNYIPVEGGTHFMIVNRAREISNIIMQDILNLNNT